MESTRVNPATSAPENPYIGTAMSAFTERVRLICDRRETSRAEWLGLRRHGLGGSDIAKAAGLSRWGGPLKTYLEKKGLLGDEPAGEPAEWGHRLEPVVRQKTAEVLGAVITPLPYLVARDDAPWMLADLDGVILHPIYGVGGYEGKTADARKADEWEAGRVPDDYRCQVLWYMAVTGLPYFIIGVLIGGNRFEWRKVDRDDAAIIDLTQIGARFWQLNVEAGVEPAPAGGDDPARYFTNKDEDGEPVDLPLELLDAIRERGEKKAAAEALLARVDEIDNAVKAMLGNRSKGAVPGYVIRFTHAAGRNGFDAERLRDERPDVYAAYAKTGKPYRIFSIKES